MADELERRVGKLEARLDQHLDVIHSFIDELREDRRVANKRIDQLDRKLEQNERMITQLVKINDNVLHLIVAMDDRVDNLEDRLGPASSE